MQDLARPAGIDAAGLSETIRRTNQDARQGRDTAFERGHSSYNRLLGDSARGLQNPCVAPIDAGPFYAIRIWPGDLGTYVGLKATSQGQVLDASDKAIEGLFSVGNDTTSVAGGSYPGAGAMIGPALTFGYLWGKHLASRTVAEAAPAN